MFKTGLTLATTAQPAIAPLSEMAVALTKSIAGRHKNVLVQDFYMGSTSLRSRFVLAWLKAHILPSRSLKPERIWDWDEWVYHPKSGQVVSRDDEAQLIPYNYLVFSVSRYEEG